jgi:hypothetical protein
MDNSTVTAIAIASAAVGAAVAYYGVNQIQEGGAAPVVHLGAAPSTPRAKKTTPRSRPRSPSTPRNHKVHTETVEEEVKREVKEVVLQRKSTPKEKWGAFWKDQYSQQREGEESA